MNERKFLAERAHHHALSVSVSVSVYASASVFVSVSVSVISLIRFHGMTQAICEYYVPQECRVRNSMA
jgi:hypothetical protein